MEIQELGEDQGVACDDTRAGHGRATVAAEELYPPCATPAEAKQPQIRAQRPQEASLVPKGRVCEPHRFSRLQIALGGSQGGKRLL